MSPDQATVGAFLVTALVALAAGARWTLPKMARFGKSMERVFENVNGRPAEFDRAGRQTKEAVPSLSAQIGDIRQAISDQTKQNERLTALETLTAAHAQRITALEQGHQIERITGHVAQAQAYKAIEEVAKNGDIEQ